MAKYEVFRNKIVLLSRFEESEKATNQFIVKVKIERLRKHFGHAMRIWRMKS